MITEPKSLGFTDVDFDRPGKHAGFVMLPHSPDDDAWGVTRVPVMVVRNGCGPTVILQGGNHGDEYEGPIALTELYREIDAATVQGRIIMLPAVNVHAVQAGRRTSPVNGLNFNRIFPGNPLGTITQEIAAFVSERLLPMADALIDLHSGGSSLLLLPSAVIIRAADPAHQRRNVALARAFGAPVTLAIDNLGETRTATATAAGGTGHNGNRDGRRRGGVARGAGALQTGYP